MKSFGIIVGGFLRKVIKNFPKPSQLVRLFTNYCQIKQNTDKKL
jgi:hypothetical protein